MFWKFFSLLFFKSTTSSLEIKAGMMGWVLAQVYLQHKSTQTLKSPSGATQLSSRRTSARRDGCKSVGGRRPYCSMLEWISMGALKKRLDPLFPPAPSKKRWPLTRLMVVRGNYQQITHNCWHSPGSMEHSQAEDGRLSAGRWDVNGVDV